MDQDELTTCAHGHKTTFADTPRCVVALFQNPRDLFKYALGKRGRNRISKLGLLTRTASDNFEFVRELEQTLNVGGIDVREVAKFMGHANTTTTEHIYAHLFNTDDHAGAMAALGALAMTPKYRGDNVIPLHG